VVVNRRLALATGVAATLVFLSAAAMLTVLLSASPARRPVPELVDAPLDVPTSAPTPTQPQVVYQDEVVWVPVAPSDGPPALGPAGPSAPPAAAEPAVPPTSTAPPAYASGAPTSATTVEAPSSVAVTTTTTRPPGVPEDWPSDRPIPPMPSGCRQPQLEDDGTWNCQH
jgi:hypothetical protein